MHQDDMNYEVNMNYEVETTEDVEFNLEVVEPDGPIKKIKLTADSSANVEVLGQLVNDYYGEKLGLDTKDFMIIRKDVSHPLKLNSSFKGNGIVDDSTLRVTLIGLASEDGDSGYGSEEEEPLADLKNNENGGYGSVVEEDSKKVSVINIDIEQESDKDESDDNMRYRSYENLYDPADYYEDDDNY
ncbi:hypothetical protein H4S07_001754 [Coemansia furcata]|uniref:Uncharacterized protein n=1 Tax=Coemansia furcata TaxID=417177 RepID=A0ACC1LMS8_9FUNG|nr:hypothetical protein H4S07_001754 [Coemansia furcata]